MAHRSTHKQSIHDRKVRELVRAYKRDGWTVRADVHGYDQPQHIGLQGFIPDLVAQKSGWTHIIEVET